MFSFILHTNHSFPSLLFSHSLSPLLIYPSPIYSSSSSVQKRAGSDGNQQSMLYQVLGPEAGPSSSPCIKTGGGNPAWGTGSQKPAHASGQVLTPVLGAPQTDQATQLPLMHNCRRLMSSHAGSLGFIFILVRLF